MQGEHGADPCDLGDIFQLLPIATHAPFNSAEKADDPLCLPETRTEILQQIRRWAAARDERYIFGLCGWAGTGKSTIARTIARECYDSPFALTASFFFSRGGGDVGNASKFVGSISSQIAIHSPAFSKSIQERLLNDRGSVTRSLPDQWNELFLRPLSTLRTVSSLKPIVLVVDALDECDAGSHIRQVLQLFKNAADTARTVPLRIWLPNQPA
jgi:hypothetical protein